MLKAGVLALNYVRNLCLIQRLLYFYVNSVTDDVNTVHQEHGNSVTR